MSDITKQKKHERETEAYKAFMPIAKRIKKIEYDNKWEIIPDPEDPLRKFILQRDTAWFKLQLVLRAKEYRHRGIWDDTGVDYRVHVKFQGFYQDRTGPLRISSHLSIRPRMTKKLLKLINEQLLPSIYSEIVGENEYYDKKKNEDKTFRNFLSELHVPPTNSSVQINRYLNNAPKEVEIVVNRQEVRLYGGISYEQFKDMATKLGWVK